MNPRGPFLKFTSKLHKGLLVVLKPLQIVNNFVFLAVAYFFGIGISALLYRLGPGRKKPRAETSSYWRPVPPASRDRNAWLRPF